MSLKDNLLFESIFKRFTLPVCGVVVFPLTVVVDKSTFISSFDTFIPSPPPKVGNLTENNAPSGDEGAGLTL